MDAARPGPATDPGKALFIDGDDALEARYGLRVPVLRDDARDIELDWPFDAEKLRGFLAP